ncbi:MAG: DUF3488 and DUF4129 domain-containing transglutaminase family protein [Bdellovibrionota bacterium]
MSDSRERPWDKSLQLLLLGIVAFNAIPHFFEVPLWASLASAILLIWKFLYLQRGLWRPPKRVLWAIAIAGSIGVVIEYRTVIGQDAAAALLVILASCKLLETNRYRDAMFVVFTSYFLLMTHLLFSQSLVSTIFMAADVLLITALMFHIHKRDRRASVRSFRPIMRTLGLALPVWIFLFIVFPRFSAGFWNMKTDPKSSIGFSERLDPGAVSDLVSSEETAFRVNFTSGAIPHPEIMYWRGAILTEGDGLQWHKAKGLPIDRKNRINEDTGVVDYEVLLEPTYRRWLFVLDYPVSVEFNQRILRLGIRETEGMVYQSSRELYSRISYNVTSSMKASRDPLTTDERERLMQLPQLDPRFKDVVAKVKAMAAERQRGTNAEKLSAAVFKYFVQEGFRYTQSPGAMTAKTGPEQLSQFFFERKRGFCEHFAAAFATVMRASGVPARVTLGYQGGKLNEFGNYILVRQMDAHAWAEVWDEEAGRWLRSDPTTVIAPLRLKVGGEYNLMDEESLSTNMTEADFNRRLSGTFFKYGIRIALMWDAVQMQWNSFLNEYDFEFQKDLLAKIGLLGVARWMLFAAVLVFFVAFGFALTFFLRKRTFKEDQALSAWRKFCAKLERAGITRSYTEGPVHFATRAIEKFPGAKSEIENISNEYSKLRYGPEPTSAEKRRFAQSVRRFSMADTSRDKDS